MDTRIYRGLRLFGCVVLSTCLAQAAPPHRLKAMHGSEHKRGHQVKNHDYEFKEINIPGGELFAYDITNSGIVSLSQVVDPSTNETKTVLYRDGEVVETVSKPGALITSFIAANNGILFGNWGDLTSHVAGTYNLETKRWTELPPIPGKPLNYYWRMNESGFGVGIACEGDWFASVNCVSWAWHPFLRKYEFIAYPNAPETRVFGVNNRRQIVGIWGAGSTPWGQLWDPAGFLAYRGEFQLLVANGRQIINVWDVNDSGAVLVDDLYGQDPDITWEQGLLRAGRYSSLPSCCTGLDTSGLIWSTHIGVNDSGDVVGNWWDDQGRTHPYMMQKK